MYDSPPVLQAVEFPINHSMGFYNSWRGYEDEDQLKRTEFTYGTNL